jgi:hypothetical protein
MAMFPTNSTITGTLHVKADPNLFGEHYCARVSNTGEYVIHRTMPPPYLNIPNSIPPSYEEHAERIMAIHLPESKLHELVHLGISEIEQQRLRKENPELARLYHQYMMMLNLYK